MSTPTFAVCIRNAGYEVSLGLRKLYEVLPDDQAKAYGRLRVIDESGEDYLFPEEFFVLLQLPEALASQLLRAT